MSCTASEIKISLDFDKESGFLQLNVNILEVKVFVFSSKQCVQLRTIINKGPKIQLKCLQVCHK